MAASCRGQEWDVCAGRSPRSYRDRCWLERTLDLIGEVGGSDLQNLVWLLRYVLVLGGMVSMGRALIAPKELVVERKAWISRFCALLQKNI